MDGGKWTSAAVVIATIIGVCSASVLLGPEDQVVPLGATATFTCRTAGELRWKVLLFVVSPAIEGDVDLLRRQGICMQDLLINNSTSPQQYTSTLVVKQPEEYNGSVITCGNPDPNSRARQSIINGQQAIVLVFGPPASAPTILTAVPAHLSLTLQWSALSAPYNTSLQYELHITEVNSNSGAMVVTLNETQYNLTRTERTCAKFLFQVAAFNAAGRGPNSTVLTASLPSAPSAGNIAGSTTHQLYLTSTGELRCHISAKPAEYCADYPVESYSVVLTQGSSGSSWTSGPFSQSGDRLEISLDSTSNITENDNYTYLIRAHNSIGYDDSEELSFYTTDVQRPVFALVDNTTLKVRCAFIERSRARGCVAELRLPSGSVAVNVTRQNISGYDIAVVNLTTSSRSSSSSSAGGGGGGGGGEGLVVYDWEEDGSRGELAIPVLPCQQVELAACFPEIYNTTTQDLAPKPSSDAVIGGVVAGAVALVIAVGGVFIAIMLLTRRQKRNITETINKHRTGGFAVRDISSERYGSGKSSAPHTQVYPMCAYNASHPSGLTDPPSHRPPPVREELNGASLSTSTSLEKPGTVSPPFYDLPENLTVKRGATTKEVAPHSPSDYHHLEHSLPSPPSPPSQPSPPSRRTPPSPPSERSGGGGGGGGGGNGDYSQLGQSRIYAVLERSVEPTPVSSGGQVPNIHQYSPQSSAGSEPPPEYCEINDLSPHKPHPPNKPRPPLTAPPPSAGTTVL